MVGLEKNARGGLERAAERDQSACLREVDLGVVRHQRGACGVKAEAGLLGLLGLDLHLDLLSRVHHTEASTF